MLESGAKVSRLNKIASNGSIFTDETVENETLQVIPVLMQLCQRDPSVKRAFFCSSRVRHIFKLHKEGGFCGYRNIQMLISHIQEAQRPGHEHFPGGTPSIFAIQELIEQAWAMGYNSSGKVETGGIKGTRKYIGTPEVNLNLRCMQSSPLLTCFLGTGTIPEPWDKASHESTYTKLHVLMIDRCEASAFSGSEGLRAHDILFQDVADYFRTGCSLEGDDKILKTDLPPIYFQHQGHSLTIVGFEVGVNGSANLIVFDPMFKTAPALRRLIGQTVTSSDPSRILKAWRRGGPYLQKYRDFEVLKLCR